MCLKKENYTHRGTIVVLCVLLTFYSYCQSQCNISVADEPVRKSAMNLPNKFQQTATASQVSWTNLNGLADTSSVRLNLVPGKISSIISLSDFRFNIPSGSIITGIRVKFKGRSQGEGKVSEALITLASGGVNAQNKAGKGYSVNQLWARSNIDRWWMYGDVEDTWNTVWSPSQINSSDFQLKIQLLNSSQHDIEAILNEVSVEVFYLALPTFCTNSILTFYNDIDKIASSYVWHIPEGFEMTSKSMFDYIIDLKVTTAQNGEHAICVDQLNGLGQIIATCCRRFFVRSCTPSTLGDFVWKDINYNGFQDVGEPGIASVKLSLLNGLGQVLATTNSDQSGKYTFTGLVEGYYSVKVDIPSQYRITKIVNGDASKDNDFLEGSSSSAVFFLPFNTINKDLDFGLVNKLTIGDFVFEDNNFNGIQDTGEKGIPNVIVTLRDATGTIVATTTTSSAGNYSFTNVAASKYTLSFVPADMALIPTRSVLGFPNTDSDILCTGNTALINFENTSLNNNIDAGFYKVGSIGNFVWFDIDDDGVQDAGEPGLADITLILTDGNGIALDTVISSADGAYIFDNLTPGKYIIRAIFPEDYGTTVQSTSPLGSAFNEAGSTSIIDLFSGKMLDNYDLGLVESKGRICGSAWLDSQADGQQLAGEAGLANVKVILANTTKIKINETVTNPDGSYCFEKVKKGDYLIGFLAHKSYQFTTPNSGNDDTDSDVIEGDTIWYTAAIHLSFGQLVEDVSAGYTYTSKIGDFIWFDGNKNGLQEATEMGLNGRRVKLYNEIDEIIGETTSANHPVTQKSGFYQFTQVKKGKYYIILDSLDGFVFTKANANTSLNSDVDAHGKSILFDILPNVDRDDIDAGYALAGGGVSGFLWQDKNYNEEFDNNIDEVLEGKEVKLFDTAGTLIATTLTDAVGNYILYPIEEGNYYISFEDIPGFVPVAQAAIFSDITSAFGGNSTDSFFVQDGLFTSGIDGGLKDGRGSISGLSWKDNNGNGILDAGEERAQGVEVSLWKDGQITDNSITDENGVYRFEELLPANYKVQFGNTFSDFVFTLKNQGTDPLVDSDVAQDGLTEEFILDLFQHVEGINSGYRGFGDLSGTVWQDDNENGINDDGLGLNGIEIRLLNSAGDTISTYISNSINNEEGKFSFSHILAGEYSILIDDPANFELTQPNIGNDDIDSDASSNGNFTSSISVILVTSGSTIDNLGVGFIFKPRASICGRVWLDTVIDGVNSNDEANVSGITVDLYSSSLVKLSTTTTDADGLYCFSGILNGEYIIGVEIPEANQITLPNIGSDVYDSDIIQMIGQIGYTDIIALGVGQNQEDVSAGLADLSSIGDFVWLDYNKNGLQDVGEFGLNDVGIELLDENGAHVTSLFSKNHPITGLPGYYSFDGLRKGGYTIKFESLPELEATIAANDVALNSDLNSNLTTALIDLGIGEHNTTIDAGYAFSRSGIIGNVWEDLNGNNVKDAQDRPIENIIVKLYAGSGVLNNIASTNSEGVYAFGPLDAGSYYLVFETLEGFDFTIPGTGPNESDVTSLLDVGSTDMLTLVNGHISDDVYAGYRNSKGSISGITWLDANGNGVFDIIESTVGNLLVRLYRDTTNIDSLFSDINGNYIFDDLLPGRYSLKFTNTDTTLYVTDKHSGIDTLRDSDIDILGFTDTFDIASFSYLVGVNAGYAGYTSVSGICFYDINENGIDDDGVAGRNGVHVCLLDETGHIIVQDTTQTINGRAGSFLFPKVPVGISRIKVRRPLYYVFSPKDQGIDDAVDSDINPDVTLDAYSDFFELMVGVVKSDLGAGIILRIPEDSRISGNLWKEATTNGLREANEEALSQTEVVLYQSGLEVRRDTSDENGNYEFLNLAEGFYTVKVIDTGYTSTFKNEGNDDSIDNDFSDFNGLTTTSEFYLGISTDTTHLDYGRAEIVSIGDFVWDDLNGNGIQDVSEPGLNNVIVDLIFEGNIYRTTSSHDGGVYHFDLVPKAIYKIRFHTPDDYASSPRKEGIDDNVDSDIDEFGNINNLSVASAGINNQVDAGFMKFGKIGDRVWVDFNSNGIQNTGEPGISNVVVELHNEDGTFVKNTITSNDTLGELGIYTFEDVVPGRYYLKFILPANYLPTMKNVGNPNTDSDINIASALTDIFTLTPDQDITNLDAGIFIPGCIGDMVWHDLNEDGEFQLSEPGISGVIVKLFTSSGLLVAKDTTDSSGKFLFNGLRSRVYYLEFTIDASQYEFTIPDNTSDDTNDSDVLMSDGKTSLIILSHGAKFFDLDAGLIDKIIIADKFEERSLPLVLEDKVNIHFSPNPATRFVQLSKTVNGHVEIGSQREYFIYDQAGRLIDRKVQEANTAELELDIATFKAGYYNVLMVQDGVATMGRLLKID